MFFNWRRKNAVVFYASKTQLPHLFKFSFNQSSLPLFLQYSLYFLLRSQVYSQAPSDMLHDTLFAFKVQSRCSPLCGVCMSNQGWFHSQLILVGWSLELFASEVLTLSLTLPNLSFRLRNVVLLVVHHYAKYAFHIRGCFTHSPSWQLVGWSLGVFASLVLTLMFLFVNEMLHFLFTLML